MLINEVTEKTGLSKKAIRFYEGKGLIQVARKENGYRVYTENDILTLKKIKALRVCGISVSDIKLLFGNIVSIDDLLSKRKKEIENEQGMRLGQFDEIESIINTYKNENFDIESPFDEVTENTTEKSDCLTVGIDIGSTTISAAVIDVKFGNQIETYTINHGLDVKGEKPFFHEQDADAICNKAIKLLQLITENHTGIRSIGVTGQMHGIVYIDINGNAVSNLITWQDKRADEPLENGGSYCDRIFKISGRQISTGFGFATHYYNIINNIVAQQAYSFCSIMDYLVMKLTGLSFPVIHNSVAASFGLFDIQKSEFDANAISKLGMSKLALPKVTDEFCVVGEYNNTPVSVAIGDNQASFIGSVKDIDGTILINIGTGSQISMLSEACENTESELRPLIKDKYILCGSALCGGKAYAILEKFFREYMLATSSSEFSQYDIINKLSFDAYVHKKQAPEVMPYFQGKRSDPLERASIGGITVENFAPGELALGFIKGICRELYDLAGAQCKTKKLIIASGNAVRKIPIMKNVIEDTFGLPVKISDNKEEAASGGAMFAAVAAGLVNSVYEISSIN